MQQTAIRLPGETDEQFDIRIHKDIAAFSYIWIMSIAVYFLRRQSAFARFHSKQAIVLFLLTIPVSFIPYLGRYMIFLLAAGMLLGFLHAARGEMSDVPLAGPLSRGELKIADLARLCMDSLRTCTATLKHLARRHLERKATVSVSPLSPSLPSLPLSSPETVDKPKPLQ